MMHLCHSFSLSPRQRGQAEISVQSLLLILTKLSKETCKATLLELLAWPSFCCGPTGAKCETAISASQILQMHFSIFKMTSLLLKDTTA